MYDLHISGWLLSDTGMKRNISNFNEGWRNEGVYKVITTSEQLLNFVYKKL